MQKRIAVGPWSVDDAHGRADAAQARPPMAASGRTAMGVRAKAGATSRTMAECSPMPPGGIGDATALELAALIRGREVSAIEAAEAAIAAVEAANPLLNAIIRFDL